MRRDLVGSSLPDPVSWVGEYGRPAWTADQWLATGAPATLAGHARGGLSLLEPGRPPRTMMDPGGGPSFTPLPWYDSLRVTYGEGGARLGFDGALGVIEGRTGGTGPRGAEAVVNVGSGDLGWDENSLMIGRRDTMSWLRGETYGLNRGIAGYLDPAGRHMWGLAGGIRRGGHGIEANFSQQGSAGRVLGTEEEATAMRIGSGRYTLTAAGGGIEAGYARGRSRHTSFSDFFDESLRNATATRWSGRLWHRSGTWASGEYRTEHVLRSESDEFNAHTRSAWGVLGWEGQAGPGRLDAELGAGRHASLGRNDMAPSIAYEVRGRNVVARAGVERVIHAVWTDLALDQQPFLQRTWAGVVDLSFGATPRFGARVTALAGRTRSRAVITRTPIEDVALRIGAAEDPEPYGFGLVTGEAHTEWWRLFASASAFALHRDPSDIQPRVDPGFAMRAVAGTRFRLFQGDIGIDVYGGLEGVGTRESELTDQRTLAGYATSSIGTVVTFGDVWITIRARNLENEIHEEPWLDSESSLEALGPGREIRFALTAVLHN